MVLDNKNISKQEIDLEESTVDSDHAGHARVYKDLSTPIVNTRLESCNL